METNELREILKLYGLQHDVVINKSSRRYSIILDNNIIGTQPRRREGGCVPSYTGRKKHILHGAR